MMLHKLKFENYSKAIPIFKELENQIAIGSVVAGNTCGEIYVDNLKSPTFAILWDKMDAIFIEGILNDGYIEALTQLISEVFKPDALRRFVPGFNIYYPNESWAELIKRKLGDLAPKKELKYYYELDKVDNGFEIIVPNHCFLKQIDKSLLSQKDLQNSDQVMGWIRSFWPSITDFIDKGIGYCLLHNEIILSWCLSVFVSGRKIELGLETGKEYRGKGYAKVVSSACIKHCLEHDLTPLWNCDAENEASVHVAESIGFRRVKDYAVWHINLGDIP